MVELGLAIGVSVLVLLAVEETPPGATVYHAWPSGECRAVFNAEGIPVGCVELPPLHHVVWVSALGRRRGRDGRRDGANRCCGQPGTELNPLGACAPRRFPDPTITPRHPGPRSTFFCLPDPVSSWSPTVGLMAETATADTPC